MRGFPKKKPGCLGSTTPPCKTGGRLDLHQHWPGRTYSRAKYVVPPSHAADSPCCFKVLVNAVTGKVKKGTFALAYPLSQRPVDVRTGIQQPHSAPSLSLLPFLLYSRE